MFQPVPFHYLEIAKVLFAEAKDCFGADMLKVHMISCSDLHGFLKARTSVAVLVR